MAERERQEARLRIVHIDTGGEMRGGQRQALLLMRGLRERGYDCLLLARAGVPVALAAAALGFEVRPASLRTVWEEAAKADIIHAHDARAHTLAAIAAREAFVVSRRVAFPVKRGFLSHWKYTRAARYLAVSRFVASELERAGVPAAKIDVVYDGFEQTDLQQTASYEFKAVALATHDPAKGRSVVEEARQLANVPILFSEDLGRDLPGASVFVYATQSEGLGSAALFAMSLGVAVIASCTGGLPEIVEDEVTGLLVSNEAAEIARALQRLANDSAFRARLGSNARARVMSAFTSEQMVERTLASYARALKTNP
jgi:glycosyltransferase involved in cell wall biosynthesis